VKRTPEYRAIAAFYGDRVAQRSQVRLMQHIDDGLNILTAIQGSDKAKRAFCLHPLFQADADLVTVGLDFMKWGRSPDAWVMMLVMEYRNRANDWLAKKVNFVRYNYDHEPVLEYTGLPTPGPLAEVRDMLVADKVQNYTDFLDHHDGKHEKSRELNAYFQQWLDILKIDDAEFNELRNLIKRKR